MSTARSTDKITKEREDRTRRVIDCVAGGFGGKWCLCICLGDLKNRTQNTNNKHALCVHIWLESGDKL